MPNRQLLDVDKLLALPQLVALNTITANQNLLMAREGIFPFIAGASFNVANQASLPTLDSGQSWIADAGTFKIENKAATPTATANTRALLESGVTDHWASITVDTIPNSLAHWLIVRAVDGSNYYRVGFNVSDARVIIQKVVAATATEIGAVTGQPVTVPGTNLGVRMVGTTMNIYINNVLVHSMTDSTHTTGTKVGFQASTLGATFRAFTLRTS